RIKPQRRENRRTAASGRTAGAGILDVNECASTCEGEAYGERAPHGALSPVRAPLADRLGRRDRLEEDGVAVGADLVEAVRLQRGVSVLVESIGAEHGAAAGGGE